MVVIRNAWEVDDKDELLALHGHGSREEFIRDRQERAKEIVDWYVSVATAAASKSGAVTGQLRSFWLASV